MAESKKKEAKRTATAEEMQKSDEAKLDTTAQVRNAASDNDSVDKKTGTVAKAGKKSSKALKEAKEKQEKEERKSHNSEIQTSEKPKQPQKPPRTRLQRRGKKFRKASELIEKDKQYSLKEALGLATKTSTVKFDATVELHINLGVDPRQADQNVRGTVSLPAGTGKAVRVAVFADVDDANSAKKAGADIAGSDDVLKQLDKGVFDFDILIAVPTMMAKLGKYARVLGPKGLMPNPKSGTVTTDVIKAVTEAKTGRVEYRVDSTGIIHLGIGKVSFGPEKLLENAQAIMVSIRSAKPASIKGTYLEAIHVTTTMGPSIPVNVGEIG